MDNNLVSVIIPIYKTEKYLHECIDSVISQTYTDLEIILVDDGSPDSCGDICDSYAAKDSRIKVIHKENGGLSDARNAGLDIASGGIIALVDSDDIISPVFIEVFVRAMLEGSCDAALLAHSTSFQDNERPVLVSSCENCRTEYILPVEAAERMFYQIYPTGAQYKICRRELYDNLRFPKGYLYEDVATTYRELLTAGKTAVIDGELYGYRIHNNSIMRQSFSEKQMICLKIRDQLQNDPLIEKYGLKPAALARTFTMIWNVFMRTSASDISFRNILWDTLKKDGRSVAWNRSPLLRKKVRLAALFTVTGKQITHFLGNKINH